MKIRAQMARGPIKFVSGRAVGFGVIHGLLTAAAMTLVTGCGGIAASVPIAPDEFPELQDVQSLIGETKQHVEAMLGQSTRVFRRGNSSYAFYVRSGTSIDFRWFFVLPLPAPGHDGNFSKHCLLLEYANDVLTSFEVEATTTSKPCPQLFWTATEAKELKDSTIQIEKSELMTRAQAGDVEAAIQLARESPGDTAPLRQLVDERGDVDMAVTLARLSKDEIGPLKNIAEHGDVVAQYEYAQLLDDNEAKVVWYCKAATQKHPDAIIALANLYASGADGVSKDTIKAFAWLIFAGRLGFISRPGEDQTYKSSRTYNACCAPRFKFSPAQRESARLMVNAWPDGQCSE